MDVNHYQSETKNSGKIIPAINRCFDKTLPAFLVLFVFACILFLGGLGRRDLSEADEPREAGIAADMARTGDIIVPRLNGMPFLEKPPLYSFAASLAFRIFGESTYTARLIPALSAIGCVIILFFLALRMNLSVRGAFLSGFALATSAEFWSIGRKNMIDMTLCFFTTAAIACFYQSARARYRKLLWYISFVASLACAILSKGFVGLVIPLSAIIFWLIVTRDFSLRRWSSLIFAVILSCIPISLWALMLYHNLGKAAVYEAIWKNNFGRFTGSFPQHVEPFYYYLKNFPGQFLPWTFFLPLAGWLLFRDSRKLQKDNPTVFILTWIFIPFILLSISAGKRSLYLLPIYPAAALAVGYAGDIVLSRREKLTAWFEIPSSILAGIALVTPLVFLAIRLWYRQPVFIMVPVTLFGLGLGLLSGLVFLKKDFNNFFPALVPSFLVLFLTFDMAITPIFNKKESFEPLFKYAEKLRSEGAQLCLLQPAERLDGAAVFYLKQRVTKLNDFEAAHELLHKSDKIIIITRKENIEKIQDINIIKNFNIGNDTIVFFTDKKLAKNDS